MTDFVKEAFDSEYCIISVIGEHAGEGIESIFKRKSEDIVNVGQAFWMVKSHKINPDILSSISPHPIYVFFVGASCKGGALPTKTNQIASCFSIDRENWSEFPEEMSSVTGKINRGARALVFDKIEENIEEKIDLWNYSEFPNIENPIKFMLGCSSSLAFKKDMSGSLLKTKTNIRNISAIARLSFPHCVYLR